MAAALSLTHPSRFPVPEQAPWSILGVSLEALLSGTAWTKTAPDGHPLSSQVHAYIISSLKKEMPNVFGKESKKKELVNNLGEIYQKIEREHQISPGDFPSLRKMQVWLSRGPMQAGGHQGRRKAEGTGFGGNPISMGKGLPERKQLG